MYFRKMSPSTTCLYSAASMDPRGPYCLAAPPVQFTAAAVGPSPHKPSPYVGRSESPAPGKALPGQEPFAPALTGSPRVFCPKSSTGLYRLMFAPGKPTSPPSRVPELAAPTDLIAETWVSL
jgi:hypothetical protein